MEKIFKQFLQEQGCYEIFQKAVLSMYKCSLQHYCREHRISEYCLEIRRSPSFTGSEADELNRKWKQRWMETKKEVLYSFLVNEGLLFQFLENLKKGETLESMCGNKTNINHVFLIRVTSHSINWGFINKKWRKYLKEKIFNF